MSHIWRRHLDYCELLSFSALGSFSPRVKIFSDAKHIFRCVCFRIYDATYMEGERRFDEMITRLLRFCLQEAIEANVYTLK